MFYLFWHGVSLGAVFSERGIFKRAEGTAEKYNEAKARETLETVLMGIAQYEKYANPEGYNQNEILDKLITDAIPGAEIRGDVAIIGEKYAYELDRSVPKIGHYLGLKKDLVWPEVEATVELASDKKSATINITASEEKNGINRIEIWLLGERIEEYTYEPSETAVTVEPPYIATQNGEYTIKAYGDLMASTTATVDGIVASVKFEPNGNEEWKKEHSTVITIQETSDKIIDAKYVWITSVTPPADDVFLEEQTFTSGDTITKNEVTGTYYLWTMLTTQSGEKVKWRSEGFNFDNTAPTAELSTEWIEEKTRNRLKIIISNAQDIHSGIDKNAKIYLTLENGNREEKNIILTNGTGEIIIDGLNMEVPTQVEMFLLDNVGNQLNYQKWVGRINFIKNGKMLREFVSSKSSSSGYTVSASEVDGGQTRFDAWASEGWGEAWGSFGFPWKRREWKDICFLEFLLCKQGQKRTDAWDSIYRKDRVGLR